MGFENTGYMGKAKMAKVFDLVNGFACCFRVCDIDKEANLFLDKELADMTAEFEQESGVEIKGK
jgi:hypothetical protein